MNDLNSLKILRTEMKDVDVFDIKQDVLDRRVFTNEEFLEIMSEQNVSLRLDLMFIILEYKQQIDQQIVPRFMDALRRYYDWIAVLWEKNRNKDNLDYKSYISYRNETSVPSHDSISVYRKELRWTIHKHLMSLRHGATEHRYLFIYGKIGTGKQTLVSQACEDITIVRHMNYKIFYLDLANCHTDEAILEMQEKLSVQMGESIRQDDRGMNCSYPSNMIDCWKRTYTRMFEKTFVDSLLVLAHVRKAKHIRDFDFKCKTVVITSNKDVVHEVSETERFLVELPKGFTEAESLELFARALKKKNSMLPAEATELCRACQGNPFLINLIALRMSEEYRNEVPINWKQHIDKLQNFSIGKSEKITRTIASTLEQFTMEERQCFRDLVIFRDNVPLSLRVLEMYWNQSKETTECLLAKLERRGLLEKRLCKNKLFYMMQYICYNEIKHPPGADMIKLHRRLLNSYSIREKLANRRELELMHEFPNDDYFHFYIGYHIDQAGQQEHDLFQELYQDFGFLEQKLRIAGLANTVDDLRKYQDYIFPALEDRDSIIDTLIEFLMGAECLLSEDSRLLQRALNFPGEIARMAERQVEKYKNRVWFLDVAHNLESSILKLCHPPLKVRFHDSNHVFVLPAKYDIQLWNLSVEYDVPPMTFKGCDDSPVKDMQCTKQFVLALNRRGLIKVWSTKTPPDRSDYRMKNSIRRESEMTLSLSNSSFSCFCVLNQSNHTELIAISDSGLLCIYKVYTSVFRTNTPDNAFPTNIRNAYLLLPIEHDSRVRSAVRWFLFLARENDGPVGIIFNMISTSVVFRFEEPICLNVYQLPTLLLFVNDRQIRRRELSADGLDEAVVVYENKYCDNTCSVLTEDKLYVVLGTERGISIIDIWEGVEVRRMNVSHSIIDLDVLPIELNMPHMLLASISKDGGNTMNLYNLSVASGGNQVVSSQYQLEGTTVFLANLDKEPVLLNTVHRHGTLQQTPLMDNDMGVLQERTFQHEQIDATVQCLIDTPSGYYLGLENGRLLKLSDWRPSAKVQEIVILTTDITYLEHFQREMDGAVSEVLVVAGKGQCLVYVNEQQEEVEITDTIRRCYLLHDRFLLLIGDRCSIQIYDLVHRSIDLVQKEIERSYGASAYHHQRTALILCTSDGIVYQLGLSQAAIESYELNPFDELRTVKPLQNRKPDEVICSCAVSAEGEFLALGCYDGRIVLHMMDANRHLAVLESHQCPVADLYFSSWTEPGSPHILVSVGEQIVFWSVDYLYNNQPRKSFSSTRRSGRFTARQIQVVGDPLNSPGEARRSTGSNHSGFSTPIAGSPVQRSFIERFDESSHWYDKRGSSGKPHLLSCIKLIGRAKRLIINRDFSKFLTMDDEGYIHYLRLYRPPSNQLLLAPPSTFGLRTASVTTPGNGNGPSNSSYAFI